MKQSKLTETKKPRHKNWDKLLYKGTNRTSSFHLQITVNIYIAVRYMYGLMNIAVRFMYRLMNIESFDIIFFCNDIETENTLNNFDF